MRVPGRRGLSAVLTTVTALALLTFGSSQATAAPSFYDPPSPLPAGEPGDIIRNEPSQFFLDPVKLLPAPALVQRIMYRSTDTNGAPNAVTGTVLTPRTPWYGRGERPIVGYAPGTQGLADRCAPSKALAAGQEYEGPFVSGLLTRGYAVVVTDYEGLGTPGVHTYVNRASQGHALLDAIRAAQRLPEAGLPARGPVAISGYSQGGGAAASAAELQPQYAPELDLKGAYAGAVPAELASVAKALDGSYSVGLVGFAMAGLDASYPDLNVADVLNARGKALLEEVKGECVGDAIIRHAFTRSADLTKDGRPLSAYLAEEPFASRVAQQRIGLRRPGAPMLVAHSALDDIVPFPQGREMAREWCGEGATVRFSTGLAPTHVGEAVAAFPEAFAWLEGRFAGTKAPSNCGTF
jgi:hypothetical protein